MKRKFKDAFTLIELLVVISIIALLMSIMMPALAKAREVAKKTACVANLKQQGVACSMYLLDYEHKFPRQDPRQDYLGYFSWGGKAGASPNARTSERLLNPYMSVMGKVKINSGDAPLMVFKCPADIGSTAGWYDPAASEGCPRQPTDFYALGASYGYNAAPGNIVKETINGVPMFWGVAGRRVEEMYKPNEVLVATCGAFGAYGFYESHKAKFMNYYWHNKKEDGWANILFTDMHVDYKKRTFDKPSSFEGEGWTQIYYLPKFR